MRSIRTFTAFLVAVLTASVCSESCGNFGQPIRTAASNGEPVDTEVSREVYKCPPTKDSPRIKCCEEQTNMCCREPYLYEVSDGVAIIIILGALVASAIVILVVSVCLLHPRCYLYGKCMRNAHPDYMPDGQPIVHKRYGLPFGSYPITNESNWYLYDQATLGDENSANSPLAGGPLGTMPTENKGNSRTYKVTGKDGLLNC